jgi:hypothetical protein
VKSLPHTVLLCVLAMSPAASQLPGSIAAERARLAEITGTRSIVDSSPRFGRLELLPPHVRIAWNSQIPYSLNDGALWAGRGLNVLASAGFATTLPSRKARVVLTLAPTIVFSQNRPFEVFPGTVPGRSPYSSPFHGPEASADLPLRFGDRYLLRLDPGQSSLSVERAGIMASLTSRDDWWGPGIHNTLILSNHAPGIPRLEFSSLARRSRIGSWEARLIAGALTESVFFDANRENDYRAISGLRVALRPAFDSTLTIGLARVVYSVIESPVVGPVTHALDVLTRWEHIATSGDTTEDGRPRQRADQIVSVFARWIFPSAGLEVYGEWSRMELPHFSTELLIAGHHTGAYVLGFQWAQQKRRVDHLRLQAEVAYLEQSRVFSDRALPDYYTGRVSPQGYTQRGQVIGASIGPGGSSQSIGVDYIAGRWQAGVFVGRVRWENDALYRQPAPNFFRHDVSVLSGLRGMYRTRWTDFQASMTYARRYNYLFQFGGSNPGGYRTVDKQNLTLSIAATPP